jgi:hypothetical protein
MKLLSDENPIFGYIFILTSNRKLFTHTYDLIIKKTKKKSLKKNVVTSGLKTYSIESH